MIILKKEKHQVNSAEIDMKLIVDVQTDIGRRREINEDNYGLSADNKLVVVCDGMGGHNAGEVASRMAVDTILESFEQLDQKEVERICPDFKPARAYEKARRLIAAIRLANHRIYSMAAKNLDHIGMGTTVAAIYLDNNYLIVAHVGDSRVYRFRDKNLEQLTRDHTWIGELVGEDKYDINGMKDFGKSNVITRAVGIDLTVKIDLLIDAVKSGDKYLLCTDGLSGPVADNDISQILEKADSNSDAIRQLIALANDRGGPDNITAAIITVAKVEKEATPVERIQTTIKEATEAVQQEAPQVIENLTKKLETVKIKMEKPVKKRSRLRLAVAGILFISALIVTFLVLLPRIDQLLKKESKTGQRQNIPGSPQQKQDTTTTPKEASSVKGTIKFFAIERDHADVIVDDKKYKLAELKKFNKYQLQLPAGTHLIEVQVDGLKIKKRVMMRSGGEVEINIEQELEKLKRTK